MKITKVPDNEIPEFLRNPWTECYRTSSGLTVIVSEDHDGNVPLLHMSVAHAGRFSALFKREIGMLPSEYRRRLGV